MQNLAEQLKPLRSRVESNRIFQQLGTLSTAQLRKMLVEPFTKPYRGRIWAELHRRRMS